MALEDGPDGTALLSDGGVKGRRRQAVAEANQSARRFERRQPVALFVQGAKVGNVAMELRVGGGEIAFGPGTAHTVAGPLESRRRGQGDWSLPQPTRGCQAKTRLGPAGVARVEVRHGRSMGPGRAWTHDSLQDLKGRPGRHQVPVRSGTVRLCCDDPLQRKRQRVPRRGAVRVCGPEPEMGEDLLDDLRPLDESEGTPLCS